VALRGGERIGASVESMHSVCFPETLVASFAEVLPDRTRVEIGMIGREGIIGWPVLLGTAHSPHSGIVQLAGGEALSLPAGKLVELCSTHAALHTALLRFVQSFTVQMGRTIVANLRDTIDRRLARWIVMLHDRIDGDTLAITHQCLADALGVRRASVTDGLHIMEGNGVLRCTRALVVVRDRAKLVALAGPSYGAAEASYSTLIAPFGRAA
jgi:CRP-like cAMP-binding protein